MRITAHIPDNVAKNVKTFADNEKMSVSAVIAEALQYYVYEKKKMETGKKVLAMIGKVHVSKDAHKELNKMRAETER